MDKILSSLRTLCSILPPDVRQEINFAEIENERIDYMKIVRACAQMVDLLIKHGYLEAKKP